MMTTKKKSARHGSGKEAVYAMEEILLQFSKIKSSEVVLFAPIYYPIANIEMKLSEESFENFEAIQLAILKLAKLNVTNHEIIADTLGLSPNYVFRVIRLLYGYGHLSDEGITELGLESISKGFKITISKVWQKFQIDALNGTILELENLLGENMMNTKEETNRFVGHLDSMNGITVEDISTQLLSSDYSNYVKKYKGILNTNVQMIHDIRFIDLTYAKAYLMKLDFSDELMIFAKRYNVNARSFHDRFTWQLFSVSSESHRKMCDLSDQLPSSSRIAKDYTKNLYNLIVENRKEEDMENVVVEALKWIYPFDEEDSQWKPRKEKGRYIVHVKDSAFKKYHSWVPRFLNSIANHGEYIVASERLGGCIVSIRAEGKEVLETAKLLKEKIDKHNKIDLLNRLKDKISDFECHETIFPKIQEVLLTL